MKKILIIGATSAIAEATAKKLAQKGNKLFLVGRNKSRLQAICSDLKIRGAESTSSCCMDANHLELHENMIKQATQDMQGIDTVLIAYGSLGNQIACEQDAEQTLQEISTNALSVASLLTHLANHFEAQKHGMIAVISSVAGDRGRQSNYVYGSAKGMVSIFTQGLRQRLQKVNVAVLTVKPGFVDTPMTKDFQKGLLWVSPEFVASKIVTAMEGRGRIIYVPGFWKIIMSIIKAIPECLFCKFKL